MSKTALIVSWIAQVLVAVIFLQTLFFKFTGAPEAVAIFTTLGVEPWGRWATGIAELIAAALLLIPRLHWVGAVLGLGLMTGALASHIVGPLGIAFQDDVTLFVMAIVAFVGSITVLWLRRSEVPVIGAQLSPAQSTDV